MLYILRKIFKQPVDANMLGTILAGLIFSTVYFNLVSFLFRINYFSLIPLAGLSSLMHFKTSLGKSFSGLLQKQLQFVFALRNLPVTVPVIIMLLYNWLLPPVSADGPGYHYSTILWFERYRVVPGLANVDGRLAYNAAAFIIQAPYAFTSLAGQSLYPLNAVLTCLFFLWMVKRILRSKGMFAGVVYFGLLCILNRVLLYNIASPAADTLVIICIAYSFIKLFDGLVIRNVTMPLALLPIIIVLYAVTAKLSAYPALLLVPFVLWHAKEKQKAFQLVAKLFFVSLFIYVPWLCRNVILSGYLFYPVPFIDIFNVDWKAPKSVLMLDYTFIKRLPINFDESLIAVKPPPFPQWVGPWLTKQFNERSRIDVVIFIVAIISPVYWLIALVKKIRPPLAVFFLWAIIYACVWLWLINVPEYRFGMVFLSFAILLPILYITTQGGKTYNALRFIPAILLIVSGVYYICTAPGKRNVHDFSLQHFLAYPLKDVQYYSKNNMNDFSYALLNSGVKLYQQDSTHLCINADLPCMVWKYGTIEMRGNELQDGFRNVQDDVNKNYPFIK